VGDFLQDLSVSGDSRAWVDRMASLEQTNNVLGLADIRKFDADVSKRTES
jgi:hypothetical protein